MCSRMGEFKLVNSILPANLLLNNEQRKMTGDNFVKFYKLLKFMI